MKTKKSYDTSEVIGTLFPIGLSVSALLPALFWGLVFSWPLAARVMYLSLLTVLVVSGFYLSIRYAWYFMVILPRETRKINAELEEESKRLRAVNARNTKNKDRNVRR